ncbi:hypothetical protein K435DRAFT_844847 [Dendrothele bispora CBS 962.96]|uniref:Tim44-like domain-containing protein n=1 Tax=Dendrothele bispora (strain CBS 962.96) TaxID=1314807 RepID=A0A4S8KYR6_DENBC|nr:hypothetical protein K435DRAFT_844847 [Dendrothele bispora CBS 962.96]
MTLHIVLLQCFSGLVYLWTQNWQKRLVGSSCHETIIARQGWRKQKLAPAVKIQRRIKSDLNPMFGKAALATVEEGEPNLAEMQKTLNFMQDHPGFDPWAQPLAAMDVVLPYKLFPKSPKTSSGQLIKAYPSSMSSRWTTFTQNFTNSIKNALAMAHIAGYNSFPDYDLNPYPPPSLIQRTTNFFSYPYRLFLASSTNPTAWVSGIRKHALESYARGQIAVARKDREELAQWTAEEYKGDLERVLKKNASGGVGGGNTYIWNLHREVSPCKVLSIRAVEGHFGKNPPTIGNRLVIQALVKFETEESLEMYSPSGKPLHAPSTSSPSSSPPLFTSSLTLSSPPSPSSSSTKTNSNSKSNKRTPAPRSPLTTYLLLEKRMFMNSNWVVRERVWAKPGAEVKA